MHSSFLPAFRNLRGTEAERHGVKKIVGVWVEGEWGRLGDGENKGVEILSQRKADPNTFQDALLYVPTTPTPSEL